MNVKRQLSVALLVGLGSGLVGCKTPMSGLAFWKGQDSSIASSAPDAGRQKYEGLAQEFGGNKGPSGNGAALGGQRPVAEEGYLASSWNKTTAAVASAFTPKPRTETDDPTSLSSNPGKIGPGPHVFAGRQLELQNKLPAAREHYEKALKADPKDLTALVSLARLSDREGSPQQAVELYHRALKAHPKTALVHNDLALCYARQKQWQRATESLTRAIELQSANPKYRNNMATVLVEMGRTDDAYRQLAAVNGEAVAHFNLGWLLQQKGRNEQAIHHLQQAVDMDASLTQAQEMLAQLRGTPAPASPQLAAQSETRLAAQPVSTSFEHLPAVEPLPSRQQPAKQPPANGSVYSVSDDEVAPIESSDSSIEKLPPIEN